VFQAVGPFDERLGVGARFGAAEDNDFGFRVLEAGYQIVYAPDAVIYHRAWRGTEDFLPTWWRYGRGKGGYYAKYASLRDPYLLGRCFRDVGLRLIRFPWRFAHQPRLALKDLAYAFGVLSAAIEWTWTERRTPAQDKCTTPG
jgi:GT2 family glycosyltransferase